MVSRAAYGLAGLVLLAAASGLNGWPAHAQPAYLQDMPLQAAPKISPWPESADPQPQEAADPDSTENPATATTEDEDIDIASLEIDWSLLDVDATLMTTNPKQQRGGPRAAASSEMTWSSQEKAYGSAVSVKQSISPFLDARVGADMTVVRQPQTLAELLAEKATNGGNEPQSSGTAWAAVTAPGVGSIWDKTAVEARINPAQDQGRIGASLSKSLKLGEQYSLTLENGYNMTQGLTPMTGSAGHTSYATDQSAKLGITDTGTSFSAGQTLSSTDERWLRRIGAEQKIVGGFNISGSIAETPLGIANKSISAGFKQSW
jgi:hypothetical protein